MAVLSESSSSKAKVVAKASVILTAAMFMSRLLGLLRDTVMASQFGIGIDTDAYRIAVTIPDTIFFLVAGGGLSTAFMPIFTEFFHTDKKEDAWRVFSAVTTLTAVFVTILIGLAWAFAVPIAEFMSAGKTIKLAGGGVRPIGPDEIRMIVHMSRIMLPAQFAFMVGSVLIATLYARNRVVAPAVAPNVYNFGIILGAILGPTLGIGIAGMSWGALIGAMLGNLLIPLLVMMKLGSHFTPNFNFQTPGLKRFFKLLGPVVFGFSLPSVAAMITQKFASYFEVGTNTVMTLSNNLMQAPLGIFGQSLAMAAFPVLAEFFATKNMPAYRRQVTSTLCTVLFLSFPSAAVLFGCAPEIVKLVYGYGKASSAADLARTVEVLQIFCLGIPAWCVQPVLMRGFFSAQQTLRPVIISTCLTAAFIGMCWLGVSMKMSYQVLPWTTNIAATLLAIFLYFALQREVGALDSMRIAVTKTKSLVLSLVAGGVAWVLMRPASHMHKLALLVYFLFAMCVVGWTYFYLAQKWWMKEAAYFEKVMNRLPGRKKEEESE